MIFDARKKLLDESYSTYQIQLKNFNYNHNKFENLFFTRTFKIHLSFLFRFPPLPPLYSDTLIATEPY